jgi:hypothetical protein
VKMTLKFLELLLKLDNGLLKFENLGLHEVRKCY